MENELVQAVQAARKRLSTSSGDGREEAAMELGAALQRLTAALFGENRPSAIQPKSRP